MSSDSFASAFAAALRPHSIWRGHISGPGGSRLLLTLRLEDGVVHVSGYLRPDAFAGIWSDGAMAVSQSRAGNGDSAARYAELVLRGLGVLTPPPPYGAPCFAVHARRLVVTVNYLPDCLAELPSTSEAVAVPPEADALVRCLDALLPAPPPTAAAPAAAEGGSGDDSGSATAGQKRRAPVAAPASAAVSRARDGLAKGGGSKFRVGYA